MRCARPTCWLFLLLVDLAAALQESWSAYPAERMTAVWRGQYATFEGFVETNCGDTQVTLPTVPSWQPQLFLSHCCHTIGWESKRYSTSLCQLAARHQQMSAHVTARREMQSWMNPGAVLLVIVQERAPSLIYFVHFAYLVSILRLASPDSIAEIFFLWRRVFMYHASSQCLLEISQSGKNNPVLSGDR